MIRRGSRSYPVHCPKPSAFLYHKAATFADRADEAKKAKDLYYIYFLLRHAPDRKQLFSEIAGYRESGSLGASLKRLPAYFEQKTSQGCLWVERENGPDPLVDDLRADIFNRFAELMAILR